MQPWPSRQSQRPGGFRAVRDVLLDGVLDGERIEPDGGGEAFGLPVPFGFGKPDGRLASPPGNPQSDGTYVYVAERLSSDGGQRQGNRSWGLGILDRGPLLRADSLRLSAVMKNCP